MFGFFIGAALGALACVFGMPKSMKKADEKIGGRYPILEQPGKHFAYTMLFMAPYVAAALVANVVVITAIFVLTH